MSEPAILRDIEYIQWAKRHGAARYNLVTSGLPAVRWDELGVDPAALEISGDNGCGYRPLLERIAARYGAHPDNVVTSFGATTANVLVFAALAGPGDRVLVERPCYEPLWRTAELVGAQVDWFDRRFRDGYVPDASELAAAVTPRTRLVVLSNLHNPSGALLDEAALRAIGEAVARAGRKRGVPDGGPWVLVDEVYLDFVPGSRPAFALDERFITTNSLTKFYALAGLRCGWVLAAPPVAERARRAMNVIHAAGVLLTEIAACAAFDRIDWLTGRARQLMAANRPLLEQFLDGSRPDMDCVVPAYGPLCFPRPKRAGGDEFERILRERYQTAVVPGRFFDVPGGFDSAGEHVRISIAGPTETVREGLARVSAALNEVRAS